MTSPADPLLAWRAEFAITSRTNYLISNSLGAMPARARASVGEYLDTWDRRGVRAWAAGWWVLQERVAADVERLLGVPRGSVSMHQNVAVASQSILSCFSFTERRNRIVVTELDFPSVTYLYEQQRRHGAEIVVVPGDARGVDVDTERLLAAIDERTALVPLNHVLFRSAAIQDARAVVERARAVGAFVILDVFQSVGTVPLHLREWGVHAAVGGALKYLCGGPGNCFLYVDPDERAALSPTFTGWAAHRQPFAFAEHQELRDDGARFAHGTPNVAALYAGRAGIGIVADIGVDAIRAKSRRQTALLIERAQALGLELRIAPDPARRGGHVSVHVPDGYEVCQALLAEDIVVDYRPRAGIRIAPHFYNTDDECVTAIERLAEIVRTGAHRRFLGQGRQPG